MAILDDIKTDISILITNMPDPDTLELQIKRATTSILRYLNDSAETYDTVQTKYIDAVVDYTIYLIDRKKSIGIKQYSEGGQSVTYISENNIIPDAIKALLPLPCLKVGGY